MSKRKCSEALEKEVLKLIYHTESNEVECICGKNIQGTHSCPNDIQEKKVIKFTRCDVENCTSCIKYLEQKAYDEQWYVDRDGYAYCSLCDAKMNYIGQKCGCEELDDGW